MERWNDASYFSSSRMWRVYWTSSWRSSLKSQNTTFISQVQMFRLLFPACYLSNCRCYYFDHQQWNYGKYTLRMTWYETLDWIKTIATNISTELDRFSRIFQRTLNDTAKNRNKKKFNWSVAILLDIIVLVLL